MCFTPMSSRSSLDYLSICYLETLERFSVRISMPRLNNCSLVRCRVFLTHAFALFSNCVAGKIVVYSRIFPNRLEQFGEVLVIVLPRL